MRSIGLAKLRPFLCWRYRAIFAQKRPTFHEPLNINVIGVTTNQRLDVLTTYLYSLIMVESTQKRATVYFEAYLHRALRLKAAETDRSVSELVNEAVREALAEDAEDLGAFEERAKEPDLLFEDVVKDLKRRGKI